MMSKLIRTTLVAGALSFIGAAAQAQPVYATQGAFTGATVVNFNSTANEAFVGNQYAGQGVTFSGALYGMTNSGDVNLFPPGAGVIASNWLYSQGANQGLSFTAAFSSLQSMTGFYLENYATQAGVVEIFAGAVSLGTINFAPSSGIQAQFWGLQSAIGFDKLEFTTTTAPNGFFAIDDFQFVAAPTAVPEPASVVLVATGLLGVFGVARRRRSASV